MGAVELKDLGDGVVGIRLNHPTQLNAMTVEMADDFRLQIDDLARGNWSLGILQGEGRAFSAGGDLAMLEERLHSSFEENQAFMYRYYESFLCLLKLPFPLIAAVNGAAIGAGLGLASACDLRVVVNDAVLGATFLHLGLHPGMGVSYFLPRLCGNKGVEWLLTACKFGGEETFRHGWASLSVSREDLEPAVLGLAEGILKGRGPALRDTVFSLRPGQEEFERVLRREARCQAKNFASEEFRSRLKELKDRVGR